MKNLQGGRVADSHYFNADLDLAFKFNAAPDPAFHCNGNPDTDQDHACHQIHSNCDHWCTDLLGPILNLHPSIFSVHGPPRLNFEPLKLLNFDFNADTDLGPAFH
jgi:hypothetical protein